MYYVYESYRVTCKGCFVVRNVQAKFFALSLFLSLTIGIDLLFSLKPFLETIKERENRSLNWCLFVDEQEEEEEINRGGEWKLQLRDDSSLFNWIECDKVPWTFLFLFFNDLTDFSLNFSDCEMNEYTMWWAVYNIHTHEKKTKGKRRRNHGWRLHLRKI